MASNIAKIIKSICRQSGNVHSVQAGLKVLKKMQSEIVDLMMRTREDLSSGKIALNRRCAKLQKERELKAKKA